MTTLKPSRRPGRLRESSRDLNLFSLESRLLLANFHWIGGAGNDWSTPANWWNDSDNGVATRAPGGPADTVTFRHAEPLNPQHAITYPADNFIGGVFGVTLVNLTVEGEDIVLGGPLSIEVTLNTRVKDDGTHNASLNIRNTSDTATATFKTQTLEILGQNGHTAVVKVQGTAMTDTSKDNVLFEVTSAATIANGADARGELLGNTQVHIKLGQGSVIGKDDPLGSASAKFEVSGNSTMEFKDLTASGKVANNRWTTNVHIGSDSFYKHPQGAYHQTSKGATLNNEGTTISTGADLDLNPDAYASVTAIDPQGPDDPYGTLTWTADPTIGYMELGGFTFYSRFNDSGQFSHSRCRI